MTRSTGPVARRGALAAAALAAFAVAFTAGCSAGQQAQTAGQVPAVPGANEEVNVPDGGRLLVRNAVVAYSSTGYAKGATVPLQLRLFNETSKPVRLVGVTSPDGQVRLVSRTSPTPGASPAATPRSPSPAATPRSPSPAATPRSPSPAATPRSPAPAGSPVNLEVPAGGYLVLSPDSGQFLQLAGLTRDLRLGYTVTLTFQFSNGVTIADVAVPLNTPTSPAPRSPMVFQEGTEGTVGHR